MAVHREFAGTDRFVIERQLGAGSMGTVYLAFDRQLGHRVALKTLLSVDAAGIYRFKKEFRALADVSHKNLVTLHELFSDGDQWFFTMEYVEGEDLLAYVQGSNRHAFSSLPRPTDPPVAATDSFDAPVRGLEMLFPSPLRDEQRLRAVLEQVVAGLSAVHAAGKLHRDLKPENVLVTSEGRAVLLDFGIAIEQHKDIHETLATVIGTPAYMSPEQCTGRGVTQATDWYSLGVILYEAMTGDVPFDGTPMEVIRRKQEGDPTPPSELVANVPEDLNELCMRLLRRDPAERPGPDEIIRTLRSQTPPSRPVPPITGVASTTFVGRNAQLKDLDNALDATDANKPVIALVHGAPGIGKTTLVDRFVEHVAATERAIVLKGRCYERESVPFKAFDNVIDSLSRYLRRLPAVEVASMLPRDVDALAELFPVLKRVDVLRKSRRRKALPQVPQELRQRAFRALKEMFSRIADLEPLVIFIDDMQWSDVDSARLLAELVTGTDRPALLLVCAYRNDQSGHERGLRWLLSQVREGPGIDTREIALGALSAEESLELALRLLGADTVEGARRISFESNGNPHLLAQLARHVQERRATGLASPQTAKGLMSFERVLEQRLSQLSADARTLLELLSVAARPVPEPMLSLVSSFRIDLSTALAELRGGKLIRGVAAHHERAVEVYHDTIREALVRAMDPVTLANWHRRLAAALEASGASDLEALTTHLLGAGEHERAALYAERAASQAAKSLAFDKSARLYAIAAEYAPPGTRRLRLLRCWGDTLVSAGRGAKAADIYLQAAGAAKADEADELRARAGIQRLLVGDLGTGLAALAEPLRSLGIEIAASLEVGLVDAVKRWNELRRRGFAFIECEDEAKNDIKLLRHDMLWDVTTGLLLHDIDRSLPLVVSCLEAALELGEPARIAAALGLFHAHVDLPFSRIGNHRLSGALDVAEALVRRLDDVQPKASLAFAKGVSVYHTGNMQTAAAELARAEELFRTHCPGGAFELRISRLVLGHLAVSVARTPDVVPVLEWRREAEERGDRISSLRLRLLEAARALWFDDPENAENGVREAKERWGAELEGINMWAERMVSGAIALYRGSFDHCRSLIYTLDDILNSTLGAVPLFRVETLLLRARLSLLVRLAPDAPRGMIERAASDIEQASKLGLPCFADDIRMVRAALAAARGEQTTAQALLDAVVVEHEDDSTLPLAALFARRAKGWLLGGEAGRRLAADASATIEKLGIAHAGRFSRQLMPGLEASAAGTAH